MCARIARVCVCVYRDDSVPSELAKTLRFIVIRVERDQKKNQPDSTSWR